MIKPLFFGAKVLTTGKGKAVLFFKGIAVNNLRFVKAVSSFAHKLKIIIQLK